MRFLVERYHAEPTIIAWDIRDKGDVDYRTGLVRQDIALRWLADTVVMIRQIDNQHYGWMATRFRSYCPIGRFCELSIFWRLC